MGKNNTKEAIAKRKKQKIIKSVITIVIVSLVLAGIVYFLIPKEIDKTNYTQITFAEFYETKDGEKNVSHTLNLLDGKKVLLKGYMAEQSPVDESFIYLVNQPYVVCPFCTLGDTTKLEVMSVSMADGTKIKFRNDPVEIYGTLEVSEKKDEFDYTTQFRIKADRIITLQEGESDKATNAYYQQLNEQGMILDIQVLQMNIDSLANKDTMVNWYQRTTPLDITNAIKEETYYDGYKKIYIDQGETISDSESGMRSYIRYIKECPSIIADIDPVDENLAKINQDLINLYNKNIELLEMVGNIYIKIQETEMTDEEKLAAFNELITYKDKNLELFNEFNEWNNELRK